MRRSDRVLPRLAHARRSRSSVYAAYYESLPTIAVPTILDIVDGESTECATDSVYRLPLRRSLGFRRGD